MTEKAIPFLKWAGGKRWLTSRLYEIADRLPFERYIEPFLGGGACFFTLSPSKAVLSDTNEKLIDCYTAIKNDWMTIKNLLEFYQKNHSKDFYYKTREITHNCIYESAAQFIYLNRTCWNGLYRVNKLGKFNVPIGSKTSVTLPSDNFELISELLKNATLIKSDFEIIINESGKGDLIFADPPYTVKHNNNGFIKYNENIFSWSDQIRLSHALKMAISRGAFVISTNAAHECIQTQYADFKQEKLSRRSVISGKNSGRGNFEELLIIGGDLEC